MHEKGVGWNQRTKPWSVASPEDIEVADDLHRGNFFLCMGVRSPLSAPATEPLGVLILCLRLMFERFWVDAFTHDQDARVGQIVRDRSRTPWSA